MPSFLELLESSSDSGVEPTTGFAPMDVLASVKTEGGRRRRRRQRRNLALSGLALLLVALPVAAIATGGDDGPDELRVADAPNERGAPGEDDHVGSTTATTAPTEVLGVVIERTPEEATGTTEAPAATTTPTTRRPRPTTTAPPATDPPETQPPLVCSNSTDPACGAFRWEPAPGGNGGLSHSDPGTLTVGPDQVLNFDVTWSDPDAVPDYFDDDTDPGHIILAKACGPTEQRFGPWSPPAPNGGSVTQHVTFPASASGTYTVTVYAASSATDCAYDPYGSEGYASFTVTVL